MPKSSSPFPPLPKKVVLPVVNTTKKNTGKTFPVPPSPCFYYAAIQSIWLNFQVDLPVLEAYLAPMGLKPARIGDMGLVNINFFNAAILYGMQTSPVNPGVGGFNETEVNILAYPAAIEKVVPDTLTLRQFLTNGDQTKRLGAFRAWVAADDPVAVAAGRQVYLENKFLTSYTYNVPTWNNPSGKPYSWTCNDPVHAKRSIYSATASLSGLDAVPGNMSEWIDLSYATKEKRVAGSRRNYLGVCDTYFLTPKTAGAVALQYGTSTHPMRKDMEQLIGSRTAAAIQIFRSTPVIAESTPYWADL